MNTDQERCEGILQQVLSVTHPVCLCDHCLRGGCFIFHSLSHTHTHTHTLSHTHTHTLLPQCYQRRPGAGVCPCQKVTGVPIGNPKIKGPLFLLYVMIPCLCLALYKLLTSGSNWGYSNKHNIECEMKFSRGRKIQTFPPFFFLVYIVLRSMFHVPYFHFFFFFHFLCSCSHDGEKKKTVCIARSPLAHTVNYACSEHKHSFYSKTVLYIHTDLNRPLLSLI